MKPKDRTKSKITVRKRTPGGTLKVKRNIRKKCTVRLCLECGKEIHGTRIQKNIPKTHRHPNRMYGSMLCIKCLEKRIKEKARGV